MKKLIIVLVIIFIAVLLFVVFVDRSADTQLSDQTQLDSVERKDAANWIGTPLKDVVSGDGFRVSDFKGKPVLLESFAVWCPTCTKQQKIIKDLHEQVGDAVVSISLDTDPNEDEDIVRRHADKNGFDWRYAVAPVEMTRALIDEFGVTVVNAPGVPIILICPDQSATLLKTGLKSVEFLQTQINNC